MSSVYVSKGPYWQQIDFVEEDTETNRGLTCWKSHSYTV